MLTFTKGGDSHHIVLSTPHGIITLGFQECSDTPCGGTVVKGRVSIVVERCKSCGFCIEFCPTHVLAFSSAFNAKGYHVPHVVHPEKCSGCDLCGMYCPDFAIYGTKGNNANRKTGGDE